MIRVQQQDFNIAEEYQGLLVSGQSGAIVTFVGRVREFQPAGDTAATQPFVLQHYPGMTENVLHAIEQAARERWPLLAVRMIHRVGQLDTDAQIVYVGVSAAHRAVAFEACHYIIDILKTQAPFWKKEGDHWVEAKTSDELAAKAWLTP